MKRMFYKCSVDGPSDIEHVDSTRAQEITIKYIENQEDFYEDSDLAIRESMFGFYEAPSDFIEISIDSKKDYRIRFECKVSKSLWFITHSSIYQKEFKTDSSTELNNIVNEFFKRNIIDFKDYFDSLEFDESPPLSFS